MEAFTICFSQSDKRVLIVRGNFSYYSAKSCLTMPVFCKCAPK